MSVDGLTDTEFPVDTEGLRRRLDEQAVALRRRSAEHAMSIPSLPCLPTSPAVAVSTSRGGDTVAPDTGGQPDRDRPAPHHDR
jgi:hypothetical protein